MRGAKTAGGSPPASLCFPSSWSLVEKFGRPLQEIHAPVPGFGRGTRTADSSTACSTVSPVAAGRAAQLVDPGRRRPLPSAVERRRASTAPPSRPSQISRTATSAAHAFIRVERQTLRKLPVSGDILFTIRIHLDPLTVLARHPDRAALAASFAAQLAALDEAQLDYKGLTADRDRLVARLDANGLGLDADPRFHLYCDTDL